MTRTKPLEQLLLARLKEFFREPGAIFWVYGFPVLLAVGLGIAFRERPPEIVRVDVVREAAGDPSAAARTLEALASSPMFIVESHDRKSCGERIRMGRTDLCVVASGGALEYVYDPARPPSLLARSQVDDRLQIEAGRRDPLPTEDRQMTEPGSRYIDFLLPGLVGMNLMGGGLWGVGYYMADLRRRKLLKRLVATPMRHGDFLVSLIGGPLVFMVPMVALMLLVGLVLFDVQVQGSILALILVTMIGAVSFSGLGLLVACRAERIETISGLMNLVMLPMWILSGIFFSSERFPAIVQPLVKLLPLTMLNVALRAVVLEGATLASQAVPLAGLLAWGGLSYVLALRWFRWS